MYLISAYFDPKTTKQLQRFINTVAEKTGNTYMLENNVPPHLTISSFETREPKKLFSIFYELGNIKCGAVNIISVGAFMPYVLYASPVLNGYLQNLSENVYEKISKMEDTAVSKCYRPYQWIPHITLGKKLDREQMLAAFEAMQIHFMPLKGQIVRLGLAKTNPHRDIAEIKLEQQSN
jgi:2'-5' RNA ligase